MANHMAEVAKMLGLELGEEFKIRGWNQEVMFRLTRAGIECYASYDEEPACWDRTNGDCMVDICTNSNNIIKIDKYRPKKNEIYWYAYWKEHLSEPGQAMWENNTHDFMRLKCGNCFRTKEEAEANKYRIYEELTGRKWSDEER